MTSATDVVTSEVKCIAEAGIDFEMQCKSHLSLAGNEKLPVSVVVSRLRNLPDAFQFRFDNAVIELPPKPQFPLLIKAVNPGACWYTLEPGSVRPRAATNINAAFVFFWENFLAGIRERKPNLTSAMSSVVTSRWIGQIYRALATE